MTPTTFAGVMATVGASAAGTKPVNLIKKLEYNKSVAKCENTARAEIEKKIVSVQISGLTYDVSH